MLNELILFILTFLLVFIIYELFLVRKAKKDKRRKKPVEVNYLIGKYNLNLDKLNYKRHCRHLCSHFTCADGSDVGSGRSAYPGRAGTVGDKMEKKKFSLEEVKMDIYEKVKETAMQSGMWQTGYINTQD